MTSRAIPKVSSLVMLATVVVTVATSDLAAGVVVGVLLSGVFFAFKVMSLMAVTSTYDEIADTRTYTVTGQMFFASADMFAESFDLRDTAPNVLIDLRAAHIWDITSVGALESVVTKMRRHGMRVELIGLNQASATLIDQNGPLDSGRYRVGTDLDERLLPEFAYPGTSVRLGSNSGRMAKVRSGLK